MFLIGQSRRLAPNWSPSFNAHRESRFPHPEEPRKRVSKDEANIRGPHGSPGDAKHRPVTRTGRRKRRRGLLTMRKDREVKK